jgi:DNA-binding MarR family transcriptional regulator
MDTKDDEPLTGLPSVLGDYTGHLLRRAFVRARACGVGVMPPGRDAKELGLLVIVDASGPLSQRELGAILTVNRSVMVKLIDRLERDGLVARERDPADRRSYALRITNPGRAMIAEMTRGALRGDAELTASLSKPERLRLAELLGRIAPDVVAHSPGELARLPGFLLPRAYLRVRGEASRSLSALGITPQQAGMLTALSAIAPCPQQRLAEALGVSGAALIESLDDLERKDLLTRQRNPDDRREQLLHLTPQGEASCAAARAILDTLHERLATEVGADDLDQLNVLLVKLLS